MKPQLEILGAGSARKIHKILSSLAAKKIILVTGGRSFESCGAKETLDKELKGFKVVIYRDFEVNPKLSDIKKGNQEKSNF